MGNVLTSLAKGDGCADKPMQILWRNYSSTQMKDIKMKLTICNSGLKAETTEHGLTEYWAHRITFCGTHPAFPKLCGWIYRHEGKKMKPELRFHAVLCSKPEKACQMAQLLQQRVLWALNEFKRDKISKQNARRLHEILSEIAPTVCKRRQILSTGQNFRPSLERCKSMGALGGPRLGAIEEEMIDDEEMLEEEEEEDFIATLKRNSCETETSSSYNDSDSGASVDWSIDSSPAGSWNVKRKGPSSTIAPTNPLKRDVFHMLGMRRAVEETLSVESGFEEPRTPT